MYHTTSTPGRVYTYEYNPLERRECTHIRELQRWKDKFTLFINRVNPTDECTVLLLRCTPTAKRRFKHYTSANDDNNNKNSGITAKDTKPPRERPSIHPLSQPSPPTLPLNPPTPTLNLSPYPPPKTPA